MTRITIWALVAATTVQPALAATLKPYTALSGPVVRLCDLFDGADERPLGPSPAPGARIAVEAAQLGAIARMFHVDWHAAGPGDRSVLERPGRALSRDDVLAPLRVLLQAEGAAADSDIELPLPTTALFPAASPPALDFSGTTFDAASGRFTTLLQATGEGMAPVQLRLSGRVQAMVELPVLRRASMPGDVIGPDDLQWTRLRAGVLRGEAVRQPVQAVGQAMRHAVAAGQPILLADLGRPVMVPKGQPLVLQLEAPGLQVTAQGVAVEAGALGERIHVMNPYSRTVLEAEITAPGHARVVPGTAPVPATPSQVAIR